MRCSLNLLVPVMVLVPLSGIAALAQAPTYNLGRTPSGEEIRAWDIAIGPAGKELPPGRGTAKEGEKIYAQKCASCHGPTGEGGEGPRLVGAKDTLKSDDPYKHYPVRTVGGYWPFATTIWSFINSDMPPKQEGSLRADEVYSLTAFLLSLNHIIQESDVIDAKSLPKIQMPNQNGFIPARMEEIPDLRKRGCVLGACP